jgi:hypothetical protein
VLKLGSKSRSATGLTEVDGLDWTREVLPLHLAPLWFIWGILIDGSRWRSRCRPPSSRLDYRAKQIADPSVRGWGYAGVRFDLAEDDRHVVVMQGGQHYPGDGAAAPSRSSSRTCILL